MKAAVFPTPTIKLTSESSRKWNFNQICESSPSFSLLPKQRASQGHECLLLTLLISALYMANPWPAHETPIKKVSSCTHECLFVARHHYPITVDSRFHGCPFYDILYFVMIPLLSDCWRRKMTPFCGNKSSARYSIFGFSPKQLCHVMSSYKRQKKRA